MQERSVRRGGGREKREGGAVTQWYIPLAAYSIDSRAVTRDSGKSRFARVRKAFKSGRGAAGPRSSSCAGLIKASDIVDRY